MNLLDLFQKVKSDEFKGIETQLLTRRRNGTIAGWTAIISAVIQVIILLFQNEKAETIIELFKIDFKSINPSSFIPFLFLFFGLLFYLLYRRTNFLFSQSKEPYRYTFYVEPFKEVETLVKKDFQFKNKERFELLHHDITMLICQRIKRFSVLKEYSADDEKETNSDALKIPDYRKSSHIHIYGNYTIREDRENDEWIVQVMPYVRIGGIDAPARMSQTIKFPLITNNTPEEFDADEYNQLIERVYSRIATEIYAQIDIDIRKKIALFPTKYLKASFLYHEAKDMAKSNTIDAFERAITLFEESKRYCDVTIRKIINNLFIKIPVLRILIASYQHIVARIQIGWATSLVYKNCLSSYAGKKMNPLFAPLKEIDRVKKRLEYLHIKISPRNKFSGDVNDKLTYFNLTYLTFPKDSWLRKILFRPSNNFFNENRRILFNAYVVESLIYSRLSSMKQAKISLKMAQAIAPDLCAEDARFLLAQAYIQPVVDKAISHLREAAEKEPTFQIAQYELAYWMELNFRSLNNLSEERAKVVLDEYEKVLRLNPGNIMALAAQGYILWLLRQYGKAQRKFKEGCEIKTIVRDTFIAQLIYGLARIKVEYIKPGKDKKNKIYFSHINDAYDLFNQAISVDPNIGAYTVGTSMARTPSSYSFITLQILERFSEFKDTVQININKAKNELTIEENKNSEKIINAVKGYVLNEYGNACYNFNLRYGEQLYLKKAIECYKMANELDPKNVTTKFNWASCIGNFEGKDFEIKNKLLEEVKDERPDWIDALGLYAMSLAMTLKNLEETSEEKSLVVTTKKSKLEDSNAITEKSFQGRISVMNKKENIPQKFDDLTKQIFDTTNRLSALYTSLKHIGKKVDELLGYNIKWELLDYDDVMALKVWAQNLYFQKDQNCIKLIDHILSNYYHEDLDLHVFKKYFLEDHCDLLDISTEEKEAEISKCEKMTKSILEYWLEQDPIHYYTLMLAKGQSFEIYNNNLLKAFRVEKNPIIANQIGNSLFQEGERSNEEDPDKRILPYKRAIYYYEEALKLSEKPIFACNLGGAYGKCGNYEEMYNQVSRAINLRRTSEDEYNDFDYYYEYLAIASKELGKLDEFVDLFESTEDILKMGDVKKAIVYNRLGNLYSEIGNYALAIDNYQKAIKFDPQPIYACNLGRTYGDIGDSEKMIEFCKQAVDLRISKKQDNYKLEYYYDYLSEAYVNADRMHEFIDLIHSTDFLKSNKKQKAYVLDKVGNYMVNSKRFNEAVEYYKYAIETDYVAVYEAHLGIVYGNNFGKWHKMIECLSGALRHRLEHKDDSSNISYYLRHLSLAYYKTDRISKFISVLNQTKEINNDPIEKALVLNHVGNLFADDKNYTKAIHYYKEAIKNHNLAVYTYNIAHCYLKSGKNEEALKSFKAGIDLRKQQKEGEIKLGGYYENLALTYNNLGKIEEFEEIFESENTLDATPEEKAGVFNTIGIIHFQNREHEKSIHYYQKAIDIHRRAIFENNLAVSYGEIRNWDKMIEHCKNAIEISRTKGDTEYSMRYYYKYLAKAYLANNNLDGFLEYIDINNDFKDDIDEKAAAYNTAGEIADLTLKFHDSVKLYFKALELNDNLEYRHNLAKAYRLTGNYIEAEKHYKIYLKQQITGNELMKDIYSTCAVLQALNITKERNEPIGYLKEALDELYLSEEDKELIINQFNEHKSKM